KSCDRGSHNTRMNSSLRQNSCSLDGQRPKPIRHVRRSNPVFGPTYQSSTREIAEKWWNPAAEYMEVRCSRSRPCEKPRTEKSCLHRLVAARTGRYRMWTCHKECSDPGANPGYATSRLIGTQRLPIQLNID